MDKIGRWIVSLNLVMINHAALARYAVVVSNATYNDPAWHAVVDTLANIHAPDVKIFTWNSSVTEVKPSLSLYMPDYVAFVCRPVVEANTNFINTVHQMTRELDTDPYGDAVWSIVTGYNASDAIRSIKASFYVKTGIGAIPLSNPYPPCHPYRPFYQAIGTFETEGGPHVRYSFSDGTVLDTMDPGHINTDRTVTFANWLNADTINIQLPGHPPVEGNFDMFVTSGHANVNEWQAHYPFPDEEGYFRSYNGQLRADTYNSGTIYINSTKPKIWLCPGNCLIANPDNINNMVYAWLHSAGGVQFMGYKVVTWYGYMGWGTYGRFCILGKYFNLGESFYAVNQCLIFDMLNNTPGTDPNGLDYDKNAVVVYGDPASSIKMYPLPDSNWYYTQNLQWIHPGGGIPDTFIFTIIANIDSVRPGQSLTPFSLLPIRIDPQTVVIETTNAHSAVITDNFVLLYCWHSGEPAFSKGTTKFVRWTAKPLVEIEEKKELIFSSRKYFLLKILSNPVGNDIILNYIIPYDERVKLNIYDTSGRLIKRLFNKIHSSGEYTIRWNRKDEKNRRVPDGIYLVILQAQKVTLATKIILVK